MAAAVPADQSIPSNVTLPSAPVVPSIRCPPGMSKATTAPSMGGNVASAQLYSTKINVTLSPAPPVPPVPPTAPVPPEPAVPVSSSPPQPPAAKASAMPRTATGHQLFATHELFPIIVALRNCVVLWICAAAAPRQHTHGPRGSPSCRRDAMASADKRETIPTYFSTRTRPPSLAINANTTIDRGRTPRRGHRDVATMGCHIIGPSGDWAGNEPVNRRMASSPGRPEARSFRCELTESSPGSRIRSRRSLQR